MEEQTFTLRRKPYINLRLRPRTYDLHTTSTLRNITRILHKNLAKTVQFRFYRKYDPFTPNNYFPLLFDYFDYLDKSYCLAPCDFTEYYSITLSLAILAYPVLQQKHTLLPILQRRYRKNRESTLHFARELFCYTICYPYFLFSKTRLI